MTLQPVDWLTQPHGTAEVTFPVTFALIVYRALVKDTIER